jgi:hypothetical protein
MQKQPTQASTRAHAHAATGGGHSNAHGHDHACKYPQLLLQVSPYFGQCRVERMLQFHYVGSLGSRNMCIHSAQRRKHCSPPGIVQLDLPNPLGNSSGHAKTAP